MVETDPLPAGGQVKLVEVAVLDCGQACGNAAGELVLFPGKTPASEGVGQVVQFWRNGAA